MADAILELKNIDKRFGALEILRGVDVTLGRGESMAILGPSGAGKSTLLHIAGLMERPSGGEIRIAGASADRLSDAEQSRRRLDTIGFLFQFHYLLPDFDVLENTLMPARLAGDDLAAKEKDARALLDRLGLSERLTHKPYQLSGGEQQRAGLARALIRKPRLLLCDEPTGNLDLKTAEDVANLIFSEAERDGVATIVVTHNRALASRASRMVQLQAGKLEPDAVVDA